MSKAVSSSDAIEVDGLVLEVLGGGKYRIHLVDVDLEVEAYAAGKMKRFRIKIIPGDLVTVELNPYEPTKGRIVYRTINKSQKGKNKRKEKAVPTSRSSANAGAISSEVISSADTKNNE